MTNRKSMLQLVSLLKPYRRKVVLILLLLICSSGINLLIPLISKDIMDKGFLLGDYPLLLRLVILTCILQLLNIMIQIITEYQRTKIANNIQYNLQEKAFDHIMKLENSYFTHINTTELLGRIDTDIQYMQSICNGSLFYVITQCASMIGGMIGLLILNYKLTAIVLLFVPFKYFIVKQNAKIRKRYMNEFIATSSGFAGWFADCVDGIKEVKIFQILSNKKKEFKELYQKQLHAQIKLDMLVQYNSAVDNGLIDVLMLIIYILGGKMVLDCQTTIGELFTFITYSVYVTGPISYILNIGFNLSSALPSVNRYNEFLQQPTEITPTK